MKITFDRKNLLSALSVGGSMAGRMKTLPILDMAKFHVVGNSVVVSSFDGENAIMKHFTAEETDGDGSFCISPRDLGNILRSLREDLISLEVNDLECTINHSKGTLVLPIDNADDFPTPVKEEPIYSLGVKCEMLYDWLKRAKDFVSNDKIRPVLTGVYMYIEDGEFGVASSDASKLFTDHIIIDDKEAKVNSILSSNAINALLEMINGKDMVKISFCEKNVLFSTRDSKLSCRKIEGAFPRFKMIIPKDNPISVSITKDELVDSVGRANLSANEGSCLLKLNVSENGKLSIDSENIGFQKKAHEECTCQLDGGEISIGVKGVFLMTCLDAIDSDEVVMEMSSPKRPILIRDKENDNRDVIVMPIFI